MLRLSLLIVLPLVALCQLSPELRRKQLKYMEEEMKPCIVHNRNCPSDGRYAYATWEPVARQLVVFKSIKECQCKPSENACLRTCMYAYTVKLYMKSTTDPSEAQKLVEYLENNYKPCILENKDCDKLGVTSSAQIAADLERLKPMFDVPNECDCDETSERCIRICYYAYLEKAYL